MLNANGTCRETFIQSRKKCLIENISLIYGKQDVRISVSVTCNVADPC